MYTIKIDKVFDYYKFHMEKIDLENMMHNSAVLLEFYIANMTC